MLHFNLAAQCEDVVVVVVVEDAGAVVGLLNVFKARVQRKESRPFGRPLPSALWARAAKWHAALVLI